MPGNDSALRFYESMGFEIANLTLRKHLPTAD
jgi:ribosomal protein S18 acetylase RimI-like enzyme